MAYNRRSVSMSTSNSEINSVEVKSFGQYFTPRFIAEFMTTLVSKPISARVLEPCAGEGVFLRILHDKGFKNITAYEIDERLGKESPIKITYGNFLEIPPKPTFDVIIGNPPYVRWKNIPENMKCVFRENEYWKKIMNGLCDLTYAFIYHSVNLLQERGELIFICPLFWTETVHGKHLREHLCKSGSLDLLINFNEARIFREISSTIIIFKYVKGIKLPHVKIIEYCSKRPVTQQVLDKIYLLNKELEHHSGELDFYTKKDGVLRAYLNKQFVGKDPWHPIPPTEQIVRQVNAIKDLARIGDIAEIGNGMVSGLDKAFRLEKKDLKALTEQERNSIIYVYKARTLDRFLPLDDPAPYIFVNHINSEKELKQYYPSFYEKLLLYKEKLKQRYNYNRYIPWWHWVFLRNKNLFEQYNTKIFVPSKERYDSRGYFRFALIQEKGKKTYYPTQDVTAICIKKGAVKEDIEYVLGMLNSRPLQKWIVYNGFSRGGVYDFSEKPISIIPIPRVNWQNQKEVEFHRLIAEVVKEIITKKCFNLVDELNNYIMKFLEIKEKIRPLSLDSFINQHPSFE